MPRYQIYTVRRALLAECTAGMSRNLGRKSLMRFAISGVDSGERARPWAMLMAAGWWSWSPSLALREPTESHGFNGFWCTVATAYMVQGYKDFLDIRSIFGWSRMELAGRYKSCGTGYAFPYLRTQLSSKVLGTQHMCCHLALLGHAHWSAQT